MSFYQLALLGTAPADLTEKLIKLLATAVSELGMTLGNEVTLHVGPEPFLPAEKCAAAALYFGGKDSILSDAEERIVKNKIPVIPVASQPKDFSIEIPSQLHSFNGVFLSNSNENRLVSILLECVGLLHRQRRVFLSYKRDESRAIAVQLFEALSARLIDVFLDTHGIMEGAQFQDALWHKLSDCDVVVMLDTPNYFASRWTRLEFGRALAKSLAILRLGWPGVAIDKRAQLARRLDLTEEDFVPEQSLLTEDAIAKVAIAIESARTTSIAIRYRNLVGTVEQAIELIGGKILGVGKGRRVAIELPDGTATFVYPRLGVPTSEMIENSTPDTDEKVAIVFDHLGVNPVWLDHIAWLESKIPQVRWIRGTEAAWELAGWEEKNG
jgi:hypothetical protein